MDILDNFDMMDSSIIDNRFRMLLRELLEDYNPQKMYVEEKEALKKFKNYLAKANQNMLQNFQ